MKETETQKAIEAVLLKHIIEENRPFLKKEITDKQRMTHAKFYLICSTPSYRGLIKGINELLAKADEEKEKRVRELEEALRECDEYFDNYADADYIQEKFAPNPEMKLLSMIRQTLKS